ncbi:MAG: hypothetical protein KatS3mg076_1468 [Candidatus Binatia bacterium]|nr:MAG: hypothetical protein KatS3mg076_1468 [Candidatus Binatia bacterium]
MRLVTFEYRGKVRLGAATRDGIADFSADRRLPRSLLELLREGGPAIEGVQRSLERGLFPLRAPDRVRLLAPLPRPGKILGVALNYASHARETGRAVPEVPTIFSKATTAVVGPGGPVVLPEVSAEVDYEGELALVVGRTMHRVPPTEALRFVAGYTILVDVTARDYQRRSGHCLAKSFDTFAPMGPSLVTSEEVGDPGNLRIVTELEGEVVQDGCTRDWIFPASELLAFLSEVLTLEPGDVVTTGTPAGVGAYRTPPRFLRPGDRLRVSIERIGVLDVAVRAASDRAESSA